MEKRPFNFEDVDASVDQIRNLVQIYDELVGDPLWTKFPPEYIQQRLDLYRALMIAAMEELRSLSASVKAALEKQEMARMAVQG